jgi:hypothetical protein
MLPNSLNTNEIKDAAGAEVEYQCIDGPTNRTREFAKVGESPYLEDRLIIGHVESGSGIKRRRRSRIRFDLDAVSGVDASVIDTSSAILILDAPVGTQTTNVQNAAVLARMMSFCASLGASTTILYDGTGNGAVVLLAGTL